MEKRKFALGFTLMELMIVIAIVGILVIVAIPSYKSYTRRAHYTEIVQAAAPYKIGVEECFQMTGDLKNCQSGLNGVPPELGTGQGAGLVDSIIVTPEGRITVKPRAKFGILADDIYELFPVIENGVLVWQTSGRGVELGYAS